MQYAWGRYPKGGRAIIAPTLQLRKQTQRKADTGPRRPSESRDFSLEFVSELGVGGILPGLCCPAISL